MDNRLKNVIEKLLDNGAIFYADYTNGFFTDFNRIYYEICKNGEDKEKFFEDTLEYLKENYFTLVDDPDIKIFTRNEYYDLFYLITNENYINFVKREYPNLFEKEVIEKYYIGKTFNELLKTERELLTKFNIKLYKNDIILNYDIGVSIKGQEVNGEIVPLAEDVFTYEFLDR